MEALDVSKGWKRGILSLLILTGSILFQESIFAAQSVTLAWAPSTDPTVVGYNVYYGAASRTYTNKIDVGAATNVTIGGLVEGVTYYFAATAYNILGVESDFSGEVSYTVPLPPAGNQAPTLNAIANVTINEDATLQTVNLSGITAGATNEIQTLTVSASSSNIGLIPNPTVNYTSPNTTGTLTFTPVPNANGTATITVTVDDGQPTNHLSSRSFTVTVNPVNDAPTLDAPANVTINEDGGPQTVSLTGISSGAANENQTLVVTATSSNTGLIPNPTVTYSSPAATGSLSFTPVANANGTATITVTVNDGQAANNLVTRTFTVTVNPVNDPPTLNAIADMSVNENSGAQTVSLSGISSGAANENQTLVVTASSSDTTVIPNPTVTYTSPGSTGSLRFTPVTNANGSATITVTVNDGQPLNNLVTRTFNVTVAPVNNQPTLNAIGNVTINEDAGPQTVGLSGISSGAANENQTLVVTAGSSNAGLIPNPTVTYSSPDATGSLSFTPVPNANGTATITVSVNDGQPANNVVTRTFTVTVSAVNDPPTLNPIADVTINESAGLQTVSLSGISSGATNENQTLVVTATSSNTGLIPNPTVSYASPNGNGTLSFTPVLNANGTATITVTVNDGQSANNTATRTFLVTVIDVNNVPTLNTINSVTINEDAGMQTVGLSGISSGAANENQTLVVSANSSNPGLVPNPAVNYTSPNTTGTLTFTPVPNANGTATVTVTVDDGQTINNLITRTFTVTVNPINDPPTLDALANLTIDEDAGAQVVNLTGISTGATNETQTLTIAATSSNPSVIPNPTVSYTSPNSTGTLTLTPATNANGTATITVTVNDGQSANNLATRTFTVTVNPVNDPPTLNPIANLGLSANAGPQTVTLSGISSGAANESQTLTVSASSSDTSLVPNPTVSYTSPSASGTLTFTPVAGARGVATVTVTVNDGQAADNLVTRTFTVTLNGVPTITAIPNQTIAVNSNTPPLPFTIGDAETPADSLMLTAVSSVPGLIPTGNIVFGGSGANRTVTLTPLAGQSGSSTISIRVSDGISVASNSFVLTVLGQPSPPSQLTIITNGAGAITPALKSQKMTAGKLYTVTAVPDAGQEFAGWSGSFHSSSPTISFLMTSNLVLEANFVPSPFTVGTYNGLFYEDDEVRLTSSGWFKVSVRKHGNYSGRFKLGTRTYTFSGKLDLQCMGTNVVRRGTNSPLVLNLRVGTGADTNEVFGQLTDGTWVASLRGDRATFQPVRNPAPYAGKYTMIIPGQPGDPSLPAGFGYATIRVNSSGTARLAAVLADGKKVSWSAPLSPDGVWPIYVPLYSGKGSILSWIAFTNRVNDDLNGELSWIKVANPTARYYPGGFTNDYAAVGSSYVPPVSGSNILNLASATMEFSGGNFLVPFTNSIALGRKSAVSNLSSNRLSMSFSLSTGTFKGKVTDPSSGIRKSFGGAVVEKLNSGYGFLLFTNQSSSVIFAP